MELAVWTAPELATDGQFTSYDSHNGYAWCHWPAPYTLDLGVLTQIQCIRFLLWDGLGVPGTGINSRRYTFGISISQDGEVWTEIFSNKNQLGGNGWFMFTFKPTWTRFVRMNCWEHTKNNQFHIVEFEVHDDVPQEPTSKNKRIIPLAFDSVDPKELNIKTLVEEAISNEIGKIGEAKKALEEVTSKSAEASNLLRQAGLLERIHIFATEARANEASAKRWLIYGLVSLAISLLTIAGFVWCDRTSFELLSEGYEQHIADSHLSVVITFFYLGKVLLMSLLVFAVTWCLKNYRSERHNYVTNQHKAMSFTLAAGIWSDSDLQGVDRETLFNEAHKTIFSHQPSGYSKEDSSSGMTNNIQGTVRT